VQARRAIQRLILLSVLLLAAVSASSGTSATQPSAQPPIPAVHRRQLASQGIEPTTEGLRQYLRSWVPGKIDSNRIAKLIRQLGDSRYQVREQATRALILLWPGSKAAVRKAIASDDPEVQARAARVLERGLSRSGDMALVLRVIDHGRFREMVPNLLKVLPHCPDDSVSRRIWSTISTLAGPADEEVLAKALGSDHDAVKIAAAIGMLKLGKGRALAGLEPTRDKASEMVRLRMARLTCFAGRRESLAVLCRLLNSPDAEVRSAAALALYDLTGEPMPFHAFEQAASARQAERWTQWLDKNPPRLPPARGALSSHWPRNIALDKAVTSAVPESAKYCLGTGRQASRLTDGRLCDPSAYPGSLRIDYRIDLRRTSDGLDVSTELPQGYRITRIVVHWRHFGGTRPNNRGGVFHYARQYELMYQPVGSPQWLTIHRCEVAPVKEPEQLSRSPLVLKYVPDKRQSMIAGLDLRHVAQLRLTASGRNWMGAYELEAYGVPEQDRTARPGVDGQ
jgi:hypothetical protein